MLGILSLVFWSLIAGGRRQVPDVHHARRQPRRGRHPRAARAPARRPTAATSRAGHARALRRRAALRRRRDHAGDLGAQRGRGARGRDAGARAVRRAAHRRRSSTALFLVQRRGTAGIGAVFGPATLVWFVSIALVGAAAGSSRQPGGPRGASTRCHARRASSSTHGLHGFLVLGSVVLCITGGEALYADMGHFGPRPIRARLVRGRVPGAAAQLLRPGRAAAGDAAGRPGSAAPRASRRRAARSTRSCPRRSLYPDGRCIATVATVIASQALISGAFSLTQQAVQLGFLPRVTIVHTSGDDRGADLRPRGQLACSWSRASRSCSSPGSSSRLAAAYGIAVTGTMAITSVLFYAVARRRWDWSRLRAGGARRPLPRRRPRVLRRQPRQALPRRLVPAGRGARRLQRDDDLAAWARAGASREHGQDARAARRLPREPQAATRRCACRARPCS